MIRLKKNAWSHAKITTYLEIWFILYVHSEDEYEKDGTEIE